MATYRYIVTVEMTPCTTLTSADIQSEIDSNLEYGVIQLDIEHFTVEPLSQVCDSPFVTAPLSPDGRYQS